MAKPNPVDENAVKILGQNVRMFRKQKGLTLNELADLCHLDYSTISRIERGQINTTVSTIFVLAKALNCQPAELIAG